MPLSPIWNAVTAHFFTSTSLSRVVGMSRVEKQREGWFTGELIYLLNKLEQDGVVGPWECECPTGIGRCKVDFKINVANTTAAVEVKTALCGFQKGTRWKLPDYVQGKKNGFILSDILKLTNLATAPKPSRYLLVFAHPAPPTEDWQTMLSSVQGKASREAPGVLVNLLRVDDSPGRELSIGWLQVA